MSMQPCLVLFGHKYLAIKWKINVNVLVNKVKKKKEKNVYIMSYYHANLNWAKFKRKELLPFLIREKLFQ